MRKTKPEHKPSGAVRLLNVLTVLMVLIMLISLGRMVSEIHRVFARTPYTSIDYSLREGNYAEMVRDYYYRNFDVAPFSSEYEEEYYVAQYADAAFRHQFFRAVGDTEAAGYYGERMDNARRASGSLEAATTDVDRILDSIPLYP